jgi:hypothetical protein
MSSSRRSCSGRSSPASSTVPGSTGSFSYRGTLAFEIVFKYRQTSGCCSFVSSKTSIVQTLASERRWSAVVSYHLAT